MTRRDARAHKWVLGLASIGLLLGFASASAAQDETTSAGESAAPTAEATPESAADAPPADVPVEDPTPPLVRTAARIITQMKSLQAEVQDLNGRMSKASPSDQLVIDRQVIEAKLEYIGLIDKLVANLAEQEAQALDWPDASEQRSFAKATVVDLTPAIIRHIVNNEKLVTAIRSERGSAELADRLEVEQRLAREVTWLDALYAAYLSNVQHLNELGADSSWATRDLSERLADRAQIQAARIELTLDQLTEIAEREASQPDGATIKVERAAIETRRTMLIESLGRLIKQMTALELDASSHQQLLITSTGEVTADIFQRGVALGIVEGWVETLRKWLSDNGQKVLFEALLFILIVGLAWLLSRIVRRVLGLVFRMQRLESSLLLRTMVVGLISNSILLAGVLVGLSQLGVELGAMLAGLGIAGFIVGFALQDSLSNFASGMMILGYRPFDVGDVIEAAGVLGTVNDMSLVNTTILTYDNRTLIVPNTKVWGGVITNLTNQDKRRVDVEVQIPYQQDVEQVVGVLAQALEGDDRILADPAPNIRLHELGESGMRFIVRPWTRTKDYWDVYWDVTRAVKERLDDAGIEIAVPRRSVQLQPGSDLVR